MELNMGAQLIAYCGINVIYIYSKHSFLRAFFKGLRCGYQRRYQAVLLFYYVAALASFLIIKNATATMAMGIICTFLMSLCYEAKIHKRIIAVLFLMILGAGGEFITLFTFEFFSNSRVDFSNSSTQKLIMVMISKVVLLLIVKLLEPFLRLAYNEKLVTLSQKGYPHLFSYWASVVIIPISSIFVMHTIAYMTMNLADSHKMRMVVCVFLILIINTIVFYLYDKLLDAYAIKMENVLLTQQVEYHIEQYRQIKEEEERIFEVRHNLKNQMLSVVSCLESNRQDSVVEICRNIDVVIGKIGTVERTVHTGIEVIDTIINYKAEVASAAGSIIKVESDLCQNYPIDAQAICVILGNALDNAIDACREWPDATGRVIVVRFSEEKRSLYFSVKNPCSHPLELKNGFPVTTKKEKAVHGIGLRSIGKVVKEHSGLMTFGVKDGFFELAVILYNKHPL